MSENIFERSQEPDFSEEIPDVDAAAAEHLEAAKIAGVPERNRAYWAGKLQEAVQERDQFALEAMAQGVDLADSGNYNLALGRVSVYMEEYESAGAAEIVEDLQNSGQ
jgi:hypothetical protein